jgi:hypothetical protein
MLNVLHHIHCLGAQPLKSRGVVTQLVKSPVLNAVVCMKLKDMPPYFVVKSLDLGLNLLLSSIPVTFL